MWTHTCLSRTAAGDQRPASLCKHTLTLVAADLAAVLVYLDHVCLSDLVKMYSSPLEPEAEKEIQATSWCAELHQAPMIMPFKERKKKRVEAVLNLSAPPPILSPPYLSLSLTLQQWMEIELSTSASAAAGAARVIVF